MKQYLGMIQAIPVVPVRYMARSAARVRLSPGRDAQDIAKLSKRMAVRFAQGKKQYSLSFDTLNLNGDWISWTEERVEKLAFFFVQAGQTHVDTILWLAAREYAHDIGITNEKKAIAYADNAVERTQLSADIASRPGILDGTEFKRIITDFTSVPLAQFGLNDESIKRNLDETARIRYSRQVKVLLVTAILPTIIGSFINGIKRPKKDEDDESAEGYYDDMVSQQIEGVLDVKMPVLGRAIYSFLKGDVLGALPALRTAESIGRAITGAQQAIQGVEMTPRNIRDLNTAVTMLTGIPILSTVSIPLRIQEVLEEPIERKKRLRRRGRQLRRIRLEEKRARR